MGIDFLQSEAAAEEAEAAAWKNLSSPNLLLRSSLGELTIIWERFIQSLQASPLFERTKQF
jgi:hypothetical protein